jgi:hypothetical protein
MEPKRAYGILAALGTKLGERARTEDALLAEIRATPDLAAFRDVVRAKVEGLVPPALVEAFFAEAVTESDWILWRARLLIQARMVKEGKGRVAGHEAGKGVGRP